MNNTDTELTPLTRHLVCLSEEYLRTLTDARLATGRAYNFHKEKHDSEGSEHVDTPFAYASLIIYIMTFTATVIFWRKNTNLNLDTDKMYFEMRDAFVAGCINLLRLEGEYCGKLDASQWANISAEISKNLLISMFVFDMLHRLYFDIKAYYKNEAEIFKLDREIEALIPLYTDVKILESKRLGVLREELISKRNELAYVNGFCNLIYFSMLIAGAAAGSVGLIALGTMANQIKSWLVSVRDWHSVIDKCHKKNEYLSNVNYFAIKNRMQFNLELIEHGMDPILESELTETLFNKYIEQQQVIMADEIAQANKKLFLDTLWYGLLITTIGLLAASSATVSVSLGVVLAFFNLVVPLTLAATPLGLVVFVFGALAYGAIKTGIYVYESSTTKPVLNFVNNQNKNTENLAPATNETSNFLTIGNAAKTC